VIDVNLKGVFLGCKYGIPALLRAGGGSIINTASFVAVVGAATAQIAYTASKGGVLAMTREIAVAYAKQGIRANALCPGPVDTPLLQQLLADPAARARRLVHVTMGRLAKAGEIAVAYAKQGIRANALCPGPVDTPLLQQLLADPAARARRLVHVPMGRLAKAGEIARAVLFLASDESSYVNGSTFLVDGGITAAYVTAE
jgi:NAD(P)-dependent dehydrogenase (short-subunit alcohol dehydrogenase family)